jgi:hypothetical protein
MRRRLLLPLALGVAALAIAGQTLAMSAPKLTGSVGPGFTIALKDSTGKKVTSLKAGKYTFTISDRATIHNFVLESQTGPKFEKELTSVSFKGTKSVTVTLAKGKWKYYCKPHENAMFGFFTVT